MRIPFLIISLFVLVSTFSQKDTVIKGVLYAPESVIAKTDKLSPSFYKQRYNEEDLLYKIVDNYGNKFESLYGTRNVRPILHGVAYRGGANNYYHKTAKRKNQNPLPNDGLTNLCQEGFSSSIYLYRINVDTTLKAAACNCIDGERNKMDYLQLDYFDKMHIYKMLKLMYESAVDSTKGPVYLHCWNGWHASGFIAAIALKQFCGYNDIDAVSYWDLATDGANKSPHYKSIRKKIRDFEPYPELVIRNALGNRICPNMPTNGKLDKSHIDIEQLVVVPEAIPVNYQIILYDLVFPAGVASIKNIGEQREVKSLLEALNKHQELVVEIGGHTDKSGRESRNINLSTRRAKFVYDYLLKQGIRSRRVAFKGYGSKYPAYSNKSKVGREANRRIEVKILAKKDYGSTSLVNEDAYKDQKIPKGILAYNKEAENGEVYILKGLVFSPNQTNIANLKNKSLKGLVKILKQNKRLKIEIGGYTDASGIKEKNDSLSLERAKSVYAFLIDNGIDSSRMTVKGYGQLKPIADNRFKWGRDKNRRIEIKIR